MGDGGTMSGGMIAEALVMRWVELGVKEDGGHMMSTVVPTTRLRLAPNTYNNVDLNGQMSGTTDFK